jgi:hypothetical protein
MTVLADGRFYFAVTVGILFGLFLSVLYFVLTRRRRYLDALVVFGAGLLGFSYDIAVYATGLLPIPVFRGTLFGFGAVSFALFTAMGIAATKLTGPRQPSSHE